MNNHKTTTKKSTEENLLIDTGKFLGLGMVGFPFKL